MRKFVQQQAPRSVFTVARTDASGGIVEKRLHFERLVRSYAAVFHTEPDEDARRRLERAVMESKEYPPRSLVTIACFPRHEASLSSSSSMEIRVLISRLSDYEDLSKTSVSRVGVVVPTGTDLVAASAQLRPNPFAKDSKWFEDRAYLERVKEKLGCDEMLLASGRHTDVQLHEGLTTNFFAITDKGRVVTASAETVLEGSMRAVVLESLAELGIPLVSRPPRLDAPSEEDESIAAAFLTSATKPCVQIKELLVQRPSCSTSIERKPLATDHPVFLKLRQRVLSKL